MHGFVCLTGNDTYSNQNKIQSPDEVWNSPAEEFWNNQVLQKSESIEDQGGVMIPQFAAFVLSLAIVYLMVMKGKKTQKKNTKKNLWPISRCLYAQNWICRCLEGKILLGFFSDKYTKKNLTPLSEFIARNLCLGTKSIGKVIYVTVLAPYIILMILLIRGLTLPGMSDGIAFYLRPDFQKLKEVKSNSVWQYHKMISYIFTPLKINSKVIFKESKHKTACFYIQKNGFIITIIVVSCFLLHWTHLGANILSNHICPKFLVKL